MEGWNGQNKQLQIWHELHVQKEVKEDAAQKLESLFKKGKPTLHIA